MIKKIVVAPDKFKSTISSKRICEIIKEVINKKIPQCEVISIPLCDGGKGSLECFVSLFHGTIKKVYTYDLTLKKKEVQIGLFNNSETVFIEAAQCAGQDLLKNNECMTTSMYGIGLLLNYAAKLSCKNVIISFGDTCTNDAATGIAVGVGIKFYNSENKEFLPTGATLKDITKIDYSQINPKIKNLNIIVLYDGELPMYGEFGSAKLTGKQKGASDQEIEILDYGLKNIAELIKNDIGIDIEGDKYGGASGGAIGGMKGFFSAKCFLGIDYLLEKIHFENYILDADLVITGEGRIDNLTLLGKTVFGVAKYCKNNNVPLLALAGEITIDNQILNQNGITFAFSINNKPYDHLVNSQESEKDLADTLENILKIYELL